MIVTRDLVYEYPGKRALDGVSFSLARASITALVGPNGAGKTTLLRCVAGLDEPYAGSIDVAGVDVLRQPREAHRYVGYLPDHFGLYAELSVRQCLLHAGRTRGLDDAALSLRLPQVAAQLGIQDKFDLRAGTLSRGQRQRLAIAQAIVHRPQVLLLDEPASGLDPESRAALSGLMRELRDEGMTLIVSSHILAELEAYCTGMLVLQDGRVIEHRVLDASAPTRQARDLRLRLSQPVPALADALRRHGLEVRSVEAAQARMAFNGDDTELSALLRTLVADGLPICEWTVERASLQDVYLQVVEHDRGVS